MIVGILLFQAVAFAVLSAIVADRKKRNPTGWGFIGLVFGLFGFIAALVVEEVEPEKPSVSQSSNGREFDPDEHEKKCPMCAEYIKLEARRCKHCGHEMSEEEVEQQIEEVKREMRKEGTEAKHTDRSSTERKGYPYAPATQKSENEPTSIVGGKEQILIIVVVLIIVIALAFAS